MPGKPKDEAKAQRTKSIDGNVGNRLHRHLTIDAELDYVKKHTRFD